MRQKNTTYRLIDLFAGAGGMTQGFLDTGRFAPVWANDMDFAAVQTYNLNFGKHCLLGDINELLAASSTVIPQAVVVIGGPPCQGFSLLNKKRRGDPRKQLWRPFLDVVARSTAAVFVMENVPQLLGSDEHRQIEKGAQAIGFAVASARLMAADYGVPQTRTRAFIVGCNFADPTTVFHPKRTNYNPRNGNWQAERLCYVDNPRPWRTVRDAIADLPPPVGTDFRDEEPPYDLHFGRSPTAKSMERYAAIPEEGANRFDLQRRRPELTPVCWIKKTSGGTDLFGRLWWDRPSFTIRTEFYKPEKGRYIHPEQHRPITHREAARFQSFPDVFRFCGSKTAVAKQIGNAVPVLLARKMAEAVVQLLSERP